MLATYMCTAQEVTFESKENAILGFNDLMEHLRSYYKTTPFINESRSFDCDRLLNDTMIAEKICSVVILDALGHNTTAEVLNMACGSEGNRCQDGLYYCCFKERASSLRSFQGLFNDKLT